MLGLGTTELILIVAVLFLLFGASRLPQLAKSLGQSRKAFKEGLKEAEDDFNDEEENRRFSKPRAPQLSSLSDDELLEEARRRAAVRRD
jgi:sec-independent protein translocase protein TatA